jgi:predicted XRE-type DNA-binding protein
LREILSEEFKDEEYRFAYAKSFLNTKLASQIKTIRQQREMSQTQIAETMGIKQPGYARFEDVNHSVWKTDTLWNIARALDVRVNIGFESFGSLIEEKEHFDRDHLKRPAFCDDPVFNPEFKRSAHNRKRRKIRSSAPVRLSKRAARRRKRPPISIDAERKPPLTEQPIAMPCPMAAGGNNNSAAGLIASGNNWGVGTSLESIHDAR